MISLKNMRLPGKFLFFNNFITSHGEESCRKTKAVFINCSIHYLNYYLYILLAVFQTRWISHDDL